MERMNWVILYLQSGTPTLSIGASTLQEEWDWEANKLAFGDLSDVFGEVEPLSYVLVFFLLTGTAIVWSLLGVLAWGAFPTRKIWPLLLALLTFSLPGGLWTELKSLERSLQKIVADRTTESKKGTARLNGLDARYGLMLETIRLLVHRRHPSSPLGTRVERLMATLKWQRYSFQGTLVRLRRQYYPRLDKILGDRDRADRHYQATQNAIQVAIADLVSMSQSSSDRHLSTAIQAIVDRLSQRLAGHSDGIALPSATARPASLAANGPGERAAILLTHNEPADASGDGSRQLTIREPLGQFIADISGKSKKYHCSEDCQIWKSLMYDFIMNRNPNLRCDCSAEIFEKSGLQLCNSCQKKRKSHKRK